MRCSDCSVQLALCARMAPPVGWLTMGQNSALACCTHHGGVSAAAHSIEAYVCTGICRLLRQLGDGRADLSNTQPGGLRNCITT